MKAEHLLKSHEWRECIRCTEKALATRASILGEHDEETCCTKLVLGQAQFFNKEYEPALETYEKLRQAELERYKVDGTKVAHLSYNIASVHCQLRRYEDSLREYNAALTYMSKARKDIAFEGKVKRCLTNVIALKEKHETDEDHD
jgi:tetratricopeptide (TPR) repeat protein